MSRNKETLTLSLPIGTKEKLEEIARQFGYFWGKSPSPSALITAIAQKDLDIGEPFTLTSQQVNALLQAIRLCVDTGNVLEAKTLSSLLLERGNLEQPLRLELLQKVSQYDQGWRIAIEQYIQTKQCFKVFYKNSKGEELEFTVRYAEFRFREKGFYLEIWCEETEDISEEDRRDFPELVHNRCLRLDRIQGISPIEGQWQNGLGWIEVQLQFTGGMVKAYEAKERDISNEVIKNEEIRIVTRRVSNPFWLMREILAYGKQCIVITPDAIRQRMYIQIRDLAASYTVKRSSRKTEQV